MPPKPKVALSTSKDLVPVGARHIQSAKRGKRDEETGQKPTTTRALILRNRGVVAVKHVTRLTGREKLDLLAEDLVEKSKNAILTPFRLEKCLNIVEAQMCQNLDDIGFLKDSDLFSELINEEIKARTPEAQMTAVMGNPSAIARIVASRIHNSYLLASAWRIVADTLYDLQKDGLTDAQLANQLKKDENLRTRYLVLYDTVNVLVNLTQAKFAVLATTTPHYSKFFKTAESDQGEKEVFFHWLELREAAISFLDSIIIELCFPRAPYPKAVLFQILHDAVDEAPKEAKRFPQALWDSVGDLSVSVEVLEMLEATLIPVVGPKVIGPDGRAWPDVPRTMPEQYEKWSDAQILSLAATEKFANFKDIIYPLSKTKNVTVLDNMWKFIDTNYKAVSGVDIDSLWALEHELFRPIPQWRVIDLKRGSGDDDGQSNGGKKKPLAITAGDDDDDDDGMPPLQDVSDSESDEYSDSDSEEGSDDDADSDDTGYDTDHEDAIRDMLRTAMDSAAQADWLNAETQVNPDLDPLGDEEERKGNPFLKLLGSLRGRMFSSSTKLKASAGSKPSGKFKFTQYAKPPPDPKSRKTTVEDVDDEDDVSTTNKKKKKKPKKKKKKAATTADGLPTLFEQLDVSAESPEVPEPPAPAAPTEPTPAAKTTPVVTPKSPAKKPPPPKKAPSASATTPAYMSTTSLVTEPATAQSARAYLQSENLDAPKTKQKTRSDQPSIFSGVLKKFGMTKDKSAEKAEKSEKRKWFGNMNRKTKGMLHQLLHTAEDDTKGHGSMKWDAFVKLMKDMGFTVDETTAGSSVRFDPPSGSNSRAVMFHKPHPGNEIGPVKLKEWSKKLQKYYGWSPEDLEGF